MVVSQDIEGLKKTSEAVAMLKALAYTDVAKATDSTKVGQGKMPLSEGTFLLKKMKGFLRGTARERATTYPSASLGSCQRY